MAYDEILKNQNSSINQGVKRKLVEREVLCCFTYEMEKLLSLSYDSSDGDLPQHEEIENFYIYPELYGEYVNFDGGTYESLEIEKERLENLLSECQEDEFEKVEKIEDEIYSLESLESEPSEIYEWWAVTPHFATMLKENGECILSYGCNEYWGRCTTGQAILLDYVIGKIAYGMEILEGQENHKFWI